MTRNTIFMRLRTALCNSACLFFGLPVFLCGMSMFRIQEISSMRSMSICRLSLATLSLASCAVTEAQTPSPIVVNSVVTPVHQPAAAVTTFSIPVSAGSFMDVSIIASYGDVVSGVNACLPSGACTALTQACPPSGSCFGATASTGEALQFYSLNVPSGITSIQVMNSSPVGGMAIAVLEASNVASFLTAAQVSNQTTGTTNPVGPSVTSSGSGIVISDLASTGTAVTAVASPFQFVQTSYGDGLAYVVNGASGTFSPSWTTQTAGRWAGFTAAFLGTTGGGPGPISVSVAPSTASVAVNATQPFTATVQNDSQNKGVTWALSGTGCSGAACGTLSANSSASGVAITYTAPGSVPNPATVTLTATSVGDGTKSSAATITVTAPPPISVSVAPTTASVTVNGTQPFTATLQNDTQSKGVTWALSGTGCSGAACGTLSANSSASGVAITYTAPSSVPNPATVTLTATSVSDGTKSSAATITVIAPPPISVSVAPTTASVAVNGTQPFTATLQNDTQSKGVTWALSGTGCSGAACGTLSANSSASGVAITYTAPSSVPNPATVTLTATSVSDGTKSSAATITVIAPPPISVSVAPTTASVAVNGTQPFTATLQNDTQSKGVTWALSGTGCSGAACGTLSANSSASGVAITYTAPSSVPNPATVTLTATSV